jgi:hypothetical protein
VNRTRRIFTGLAGLASLATVVGLAAPAMASSTPPPVKPKLSTIACQVTSPTCNEPVVAISQTSGTDFVPADDAALSVVSLGRVFTRPNNALDNGTQDWTFVRVDRVPFFFGSGSYGFTSFDRNHYGGRFVYQLEWTPFGQDTGRCLNIRSLSHLAYLANCDGRFGEAFIVTTSVPGLNPPGAINYVFALSVRQASTLARHQLLTANDTGFGQVTVARAINHSPGVATQQMWSTLP